MRDTGDGADAHEPLVVTLGVDVCVGIAVARGDRHVGSFLLVSASAPDTLLHLQETYVVQRDGCMPSRQPDTSFSATLDACSTGGLTASYPGI